MILRPLVITRLANAGVWLIFVPLGLQLAGLMSLVVSVPLAGWLGTRGYRMGVVLEDSAITVRGYLWSRRIPADAIAGISPFPAVRWVSVRGSRRWTPVLAFAATGVVSPVRKKNERAFERLTDWHWTATAQQRRRQGRGRG